jgi:hypothetical protein
VSQPETVILQAIRLAVGKAVKGVRLFRNHAGIFWAGRVVSYDADAHVVTLCNAQRVQGGLVDGASDLIGWRSVVVTPDMVGRRVAVFCAPEVKVPGAKPPPAEQITWRDNVLSAGGIAGIVHSPDETLALLQQPVGVSA